MTPIDLMFASLASVLFLGIIPPPALHSMPGPLPGIELLAVSAPSRITQALELAQLSASGAILLDADSGEELYAKDADTPRPIASLTKIMTAIVTLENRRPGEVFTVPAIAEQVHGSGLGLRPGEHMTVGNLLKAILLLSANDAAYTLAANAPRGLVGFVQSMNERAQSLGLKHTHFVNPAGLDHPDQYSTPREMAWLTLAALRLPAFAATVQMKSARVASQEGDTWDLRNTNELLHENPNVFGVKTGTTDGAGECLVVLFREANRSYLLVLLGSQDRYTDGLYVLAAVHDAQQ